MSFLFALAKHVVRYHEITLKLAELVPGKKFNTISALTRYVYGKKYANKMNDSDNTHIEKALSLQGLGSISLFSRFKRFGLSNAK